MWRFRTYCLWLEEGTQDVDGGIFASKPGYHNYRNALRSTDYSVRLPPDQEGPGDKASAFDWTFRTAQGGNYARIMFYMDRVEAAFNREDPRLYGFREVLGQADPDSDAEGFDFYYWTRRTPDDSHLWHIHFSKHRKYINDRRSYDAMLSILVGQSLAEWEEDEDMTPQQAQQLRDTHYTTAVAIDNPEGDGKIPLHVYMKWLTSMVKLLVTQVNVDEQELAAIRQAANEGASESVQAIIDGVLAGLPEGQALTKDDVRQAMREFYAPALQ